MPVKSKKCSKCSKKFKGPTGEKLCAVCEVDNVTVSAETDAEFSQLFQEAHGHSSFSGDVLNHGKRLAALNGKLSGPQQKEAVRLKEEHDVIQGKLAQLQNKLLLAALMPTDAKKDRALSPVNRDSTSGSNSGHALLTRSPSVKELKKQFQFDEVAVKELSRVSPVKILVEKVETPKTPMTPKMADVVLEAFVNKENKTNNTDANNNAEEKSNATKLQRQSSVRDRVKAFETMCRRAKSFSSVELRKMSSSGK